MKTNITKILLISFILIGLFGCSANKIDNKPRPSSAGKLQVVDGQLCDKKANPIQLQGVSTYNMNWTSYYINEDLFKQVSNEWHMNIIRLAMYTKGSEGYCNGGNQEKIKGFIDKGVNLAKDNDMYVIIDWHILEDGNPNTFVEESKKFFDEMSNKYKDYNNVLYEICNEPNGDITWQDIKDYANIIIPTIRNNDPNSVIIVGNTDWSKGIKECLNDPLDYENIMYTFHFYATSHLQEYRDIVDYCASKKLPIFVTEYGVCTSNAGFPYDFESSEAWWDLMNKYNISSCMWDLSSVAEAASMIKHGVVKQKGFVTEDLTEAGLWLIDKLKPNN